MVEQRKCYCDRALGSSVEDELQFDFEDEGSKRTSGPRDTLEQRDLKFAIRRSLFVTARDRQILNEVHRLCRERAELGTRATVVDVAERLSALGLPVRIRKTLGAKACDVCYAALRHEVITYKRGHKISSHPGRRLGPGGFEVDDVIIDVGFRESFELARPTQAYRELLEELPDVFLGPPECLQQIVGIMCEQAVKAFSASGLPLPPWRSKQTLLTKWFSSNTMEEEVPHFGTFPACANDCSSPENTFSWAKLSVGHSLSSCSSLSSSGRSSPTVVYGFEL